MTSRQIYSICYRRAQIRTLFVNYFPPHLRLEVLTWHAATHYRAAVGQAERRPFRRLGGGYVDEETDSRHRTAPAKFRNTAMFKVYGRANSINVRKVLWMLDEVGQPYSREDWGRGYRPTSEAEFKTVSNFGVVPVVSDDGFILRESQSIVRYLANKHARHDLYPADLKTRALTIMV